MVYYHLDGGRWGLFDKGWPVYEGSLQKTQGYLAMHSGSFFGNILSNQSERAEEAI